MRLARDGGVDRVIVGRREDEECSVEIAWSVAPLVPRQRGSSRLLFELGRERRANDGHGGTGVEEAADFAFGDRSAADDDRAAGAYVE